MKWLNPINWIKAAVVAKINAVVEERVQTEYLTELGRGQINYLVTLSESKLDDEKVRAISADLIYCGESLKELGNAIDPSGEEGRKFSPNEVSALMSRVQVLFGDVITDEQLTEWREKIKNFIAEKIGA